MGKWTNPEDAIWFVWRPARWANWMFQTDKAQNQALRLPALPTT